MSKPVNHQLELVPAADTKPAISQPADTKVADAASVAEGIIAKALAQAGPENDWSADNPELLFPCQPATQVYLNNYNQVIVMQESRSEYEDDPFLMFSPGSLPALIAALKRHLP